MRPRATLKMDLCLARRLVEMTIRGPSQIKLLQNWWFSHLTTKSKNRKMHFWARTKSMGTGTSSHYIICLHDKSSSCLKHFLKLLFSLKCKNKKRRKSTANWKVLEGQSQGINKIVTCESWNCSYSFNSLPPYLLCVFINCVVQKWLRLGSISPFTWCSSLSQCLL